MALTLGSVVRDRNVTSQLTNCKNCLAESHPVGVLVLVVEFEGNIQNPCPRCELVTAQSTEPLLSRCMRSCGLKNQQRGKLLRKQPFVCLAYSSTQVRYVLHLFVRNLRSQDLRRENRGFYKPERYSLQITERENHDAVREGCTRNTWYLQRDRSSRNQLFPPPPPPRIRSR